MIRAVNCSTVLRLFVSFKDSYNLGPVKHIRKKISAPRRFDSSRFDVTEDSPQGFTTFSVHHHHRMYPSGGWTPVNQPKMYM